MRWEFLLVLLAVFVEAIVLLAKSMRGEAEKWTPPERTPPRPVRTPRPRPTSIEMDQFLQQINQRRKEVAARQQQVLQAPRSRPTSPVPDRSPTGPVEPVTRKPAAPVVDTSRRLGPGPRPRPPRSTQAPAAQTIAQAQAVVEEVVVARVREAPGSLAAQIAAAPPLPKGARVAARRIDSPVGAQVRELLASSQGRQTAFVLQEILARPLCQRAPQGPVPALRIG